MNKVIMIGRMTKDPELRTTNSGTNVATFSIAVDRRFHDANGNRQADFFDCVAWRQTADFVKQYFSKGKRIALVGSLQNREYTAQDGSKRRVTEIIADEVEFAESKQEAPKPAPTPQGFTEVDDDESTLPF